MKKLIEALRLKHEANLSNERIAAACGMSKGAVHKYLALAKARNISWPLADDMDEGKLEALLFPAKSPPAEFEQPDCPQHGMNTELTVTHSTASTTDAGRSNKNAACGNCTALVKNCLSTTAAPPWK